MINATFIIKRLKIFVTKSIIKNNFNRNSLVLLLKLSKIFAANIVVENTVKVISIFYNKKFRKISIYIQLSLNRIKPSLLKRVDVDL